MSSSAAAAVDQHPSGSATCLAQDTASISTTWTVSGGQVDEVVALYTTSAELRQSLAEEPPAPLILTGGNPEMQEDSETSRSSLNRCEVVIEFHNNVGCNLEQVVVRGTTRNIEILVTFWDSDDQVELPWRYLATSSAKKLENTKITTEAEEYQLYAASRMMPVNIQKRTIKRIKLRLLSLTTNGFAIVDKLALVAKTQPIAESESASQPQQQRQTQATETMDQQMSHAIAQAAQRSMGLLSRGGDGTIATAQEHHSTHPPVLHPDGIQTAILNEIREMRKDMNSSLASLNKRVGHLEKQIQDVLRYQSSNES